jgi:tripartite-type tricarboxylate transporter receptor subunit TctC
MQFTQQRRRVLQAGTALAASAALSARAQDLSKPLRIIVPQPAGGTADNSVRICGEYWTALTKQPVTVDNRPGGAYQIGVQQLLQSPADGNTWIHLNSEMPAAQATFGRFDLNKQISPLGLMGSTPGTIFVNEASPWRTVKDLTDWIRANPNKLSYGTVIGGAGHFVSASMLRRAGLTGTAIAFKGGPDSCTALAQNEIQMVISALPLVIPFKGRIRPLVILTEQRSPLTPDVPTYKEAGLDIPELDYWGAFGVPAGTPAATIASLNRNINEVLRNPALVSKYTAQAMYPRGSSPEAMARTIADEVKWMTPVAADLNLKAS